jgi:hypothetical protein
MARLSRDAGIVALRTVRHDPILALRAALALAAHWERVAELFRVRRQLLSARAEWDDVRVRSELNAAMADLMDVVTRTQKRGLSRALSDRRLIEGLSESVDHLANALDSIGRVKRRRRRLRRGAIGAAAALGAASLAAWVFTRGIIRAGTGRRPR